MAVTLQEIAEKAGVSRGTVDRALNNRGRIRPELAEQIKQIAHDMGYRPSLSGRALAFSKKNMKIGVILQFAETPFIEEIQKGIIDAKKEIEGFGCGLVVRYVEGVNTDAVIRYMEEMAEEKISAIALIATDNERLREEIASCMDRGINVITLNSDISESRRICFIGQDAYRSGRTAAGIMADLLQGRGKVGILSGSSASTVKNRRVIGFCEELYDEYPEIELVEVRHSGDNIERLEDQAEELLLNQPDIDGIYMNSEGKNELCDILREYHMDKKVRVIVHDLVGCKRPNIEDRTIDYIIDEDSYIQGYQPVMTLFRMLYDHEEPESEFMYTEIKILTKYNI